MTTNNSLKRLDTHVQGALGSKIHVGDFVVWPGRQSSSMWISCGVVTGITIKPHPWRANTESVALTITKAVSKDKWDGGKRVVGPATSRKTTVTVLDRVVPVDINAVTIEDDKRAILNRASYIALHMGEIPTP